MVIRNGWLVILFSAFAGAHAHAGPALIERVEILSDSVSFGGRIELEADVKPKRTETLLLNGASPSYSFDLPAPLLVKKLHLSFDYSARENVPARITSLPVATLYSEIDVKGDKNGMKPLKLKLKKQEARINGRDQQDEELACKSFVSVSSEGKIMKISITGFKTLASCQGKEVYKADPLQIGLRDVATGKNKYSFEEDVNFGKQFTEEFIRKNSDKILPETHPTTVYFQGLMNRIAAVSDLPALQPKVHVVNADILNAFALPGGYVFVFRGLIDSSRSEAEVVGVLGHEWAHVTARHGTKNVTRAQSVIKKYLIAKLVALGLVIGGNVSDKDYLSVVGQVLWQTSDLTTVLYLLNKSRDAEDEADKIGAQYAWAAGFEPWGLSDMFEVFLAKTGYRSKLEGAFSDHPLLQSRIQNVHNLSALFFPVKREYTHQTGGFEDARRELSHIPYPPHADSVNMGDGFVEQLNSQVGGIMDAYALSQKKVIVGAIVGGSILKGIFGGGKKKPDPDDEGDSQ